MSDVLSTRPPGGSAILDAGHSESLQKDINLIFTTLQELEQLRREKWHLAGQPVRTIDDARAFVNACGFCTVYPEKPAWLVPTFVGAWLGSDEKLPTATLAFKDERAHDANDLLIRLLRGRDAFEINLAGENNAVIVALAVFPYVYALVGDRSPKQVPLAASGYSQLACDTFALIQRKGPISKREILEQIGGSISPPALDGALSELWAKLRVTRVAYSVKDGATWDVLFRWAPEEVREGVNLGISEAITAVLTKYLGCLIAAEQQELENFLGHFVARSRVREAVNALLAARELEYVRVESKTLIQFTPAKSDPRSVIQAHTLR